MSASVQNIPDLSSCVLSHGGARLSDTPGEVFHLDNETRDDHAAAFPALRSVGVKREAGATPTQQFDADYTVDVNIRAGHRFEGSVAGKLESHSIPLCVTGEGYGTLRGDYKDASLTFFASFFSARLNQIAHTFPHKPNNRTFGSFLCGVSDSYPSTFCVGFALPFLRRQLASGANAARLSIPVHIQKNPPADLRKFLPSLRRVSALPLHDSNNVTERFADVQKVFAKAGACDE